MRSCPTCGAGVPDGARYCPECGTRIEDAGETLVEPVPPLESGPAPAAFGEQPRWFGITPPLAVFALAATALALAILVFATGRWIAGIVLLLASGALFLFFGSELRRKPDSPAARASLDAVGGVRARIGAAVDAFGAVSTARRELLRLRREHEDLTREKGRLLRSLGEAVYLGDDQATEKARADLSEVDGALSAKEDEMTTIAGEMRERYSAARAEVMHTELLEPVPVVPEPAPPPDEGTPPMPAPVPEPYPPPDEGTPPQPDPLPEPEDPGSKR